MAWYKHSHRDIIIDEKKKRLKRLKITLRRRCGWLRALGAGERIFSSQVIHAGWHHQRIVSVTQLYSSNVQLNAEFGGAGLWVSPRLSTCNCYTCVYIHTYTLTTNECSRICRINGLSTVRIMLLWLQWKPTTPPESLQHFMNLSIFNIVSFWYLLVHAFPRQLMCKKFWTFMWTKVKKI